MLLTTMKRLLGFWKPHKLLGAGLAITMVLRAVFTVILALAVKFVIDGVIDPSSTPSVWWVGLVLVGGLAVSLGAGLVAAHLTARAASEIVADVRTQTFEHLQHLPMQYFDKMSTGDLIAHFSSDIAQLSRGVINKPLIGLRAVAAMALYIPAMFLLDARLAVVATVVIPVVVYVVYRWAPASAPALDTEKVRIAEVLQEVSGNLRAQRLLRAFALGGQARIRFQSRIEDLRGASFTAEGRIALEMVIAEYSVEVAKVAIIVVGAAFAFAGTLDPGSFAAFVAILTEFSYQASVLGMDVLPSVKQSEAGIRRIDALLSVPTGRTRTATQELPPLSSEIEFEDVVLRYHPSDPVPQLGGLSLNIPENSYVAIVGPNGSGKSSILSVLLGIYDIEAGRVRIGGVDLSDVDIDAVRRRTGIAFQETVLFDATVGDNIALDEDLCTETDILRSIEESGLGDVVRRLPLGLNTMLGDDGMSLSSGEAQRIGLARALARSPELILLDEVASSLDPETEASVFSTIEDLRDGRSIVSITHRLETVKTADLILVIDRGRVVESGGFESLIARGGIFSDMWTKQHGFDVSANGLTATVRPNRLRAIPLFAELADEALIDLAAAFDSEPFDPGDVVFKEGEPGASFYVVARGAVDVISGLGGEDERIIAQLGDGDFFGEMAILSHQRRNASVRSRGRSTLLRLDRRSFQSFLATSPESRRIVEAVAAQRGRANEAAERQTHHGVNVENI